MVDEPTERRASRVGAGAQRKGRGQRYADEHAPQLQPARDIRRADRAEGNAGPAQALLNGNQCVGPGLSEPNLAQEHLSPQSFFRRLLFGEFAGEVRPSQPASFRNPFADRFPWGRLR